MKKYLFLLFLLSTVLTYADGQFYCEYWAIFDEKISNHKDGRWRVNDPELALHENFGKRSEALANGLVLLNAPENLFDLEKAELYLEMWGGHPHTENKRVTVNGKGIYKIPDYGTSHGFCVYAYPTVEVEPKHLVSGVNAFQFSCDRGHGFWGHFIMDNVALRCFFKKDSLIRRFPELKQFSTKLIVPSIIKNDLVNIVVDIPKQFQPEVESVDIFARYVGFDDNGNLEDYDWHGYTYKKEWVHHVGSLSSFPFEKNWDMTKIPDQSQPIQFKAIIKIKNGLCYETEPTPGSLLERQKQSVKMFYCYDAPIPFWSRAENVKVGKMYIPIDPQKIIAAQLHIKIWDGGEGDVKEPFKINGFPYAITSGNSIHDVVHTVVDVDIDHVRNGSNELLLLSDTEHHGIEILRPGPCLIVRVNK